MPSTRSGVAVRGINHHYGDLEAIRELSLEIHPGEILGLVGTSGCGKSTLIELIAGLLGEPSGGTISIGSAASPAERLALCAYMPQDDMLFPWYSAIENATLSLRNRGLSKATAHSQAAGLFGQVGLGGFEDARPGQLSGGMRQRVAFLRTLLSGKPVLLLDEPFASLDAITRAQMQVWLAATLDLRPATTVLVTHDVEEALYLSDRVVVLSGRPARVIATLDSPRPRAGDREATIADPAFVEMRTVTMRLLNADMAAVS